MSLRQELTPNVYTINIRWDIRATPLRSNGHTFSIFKSKAVTLAVNVIAVIIIHTKKTADFAYFLMGMGNKIMEISSFDMTLDANTINLLINVAAISLTIQLQMFLTEGMFYCHFRFKYTTFCKVICRYTLFISTQVVRIINILTNFWPTFINALIWCNSRAKVRMYQY